MKIQYPLLILLLAIQYSLAGQPMEIRRLLHLQKEIKEDTSHVLWYNDVSKAYRMVNPDSSIYYAGEGINLANRSGFQKGLGLCYSSIAIGYSIKGLFTEGTAYCQKAIDINKRVNRAQLPTNYTNMGIILQSQARLTEGLKYQNMALEVAKEVGDKVYIAKAYNNIGDALLAQGNYQQAVGYFYKFLKVADELNDSLGISIAYGNISNVLRLQQDFNLALEYQQKTMAFHKRMNNKVSLLSDYYNTGNIYFALNRIDEAIHHYTDAIRLAREIGNEKELGLIYVYTGAAYLRKKNYAAAENFLLKADTLNKKTNNINGLTVGSISLSRLFEQLNKPGLQKQFAFKALELARRENLKPEMRDASEILYRYYKQQGNSKEALLYHELFTGYKDSLFNVETIRQVKAAEYKYAADDQQEKILLLQKQNELKQKENNIQRLYMVGFVLLFAASCKLHALLPTPG
jgi:tetratricopeptide (TPR) repeat protein